MKTAVGLGVGSAVVFGSTDLTAAPAAAAATPMPGSRRSISANTFKKITTKISGSRTKVMIGGKTAKRSKNTVGISCELTYEGSGSESKAVACR